MKGFRHHNTILVFEERCYLRDGASVSRRRKDYGVAQALLDYNPSHSYSFGRKRFDPFG